MMAMKINQPPLPIRKKAKHKEIYKAILTVKNFTVKLLPVTNELSFVFFNGVIYCWFWGRPGFLTDYSSVVFGSLIFAHPSLYSLFRGADFSEGLL